MDSESPSVSAPGLPAPFRECLQLLECPTTRQPLVLAAGGMMTLDGQRCYPVADGIPNLFVPLDGLAANSDVTELVKAFYEETPFPNYDHLDSRESLARKAKLTQFAAMLDQQLPSGAIVLEAGCGTGQLTNFLGMSWQRRVFGGEICLNSLQLAKNFRDRFRIENAAFLQMNLFRPPFRDESLDVIISNGVLHHTGDPRGGFAALIRKLNPGGLVLIGLYNSLGRLPTLWRRRLFDRFDPALYFLDRHLPNSSMNRGRWQAWYPDQYAHPHESKHTINEVMHWFDANDLEFLSSIPPADGTAFSPELALFQPHRRGSRLQHRTVELRMLMEGGQDGGLFIMIGRERK
jgi:SAM-dependent methyltransferase